MAGVDDDGFARTAPHGEIGGGITGVIKAARAEFFRERAEFVFAAKIRLAVARQHFIKQADVCSDGLRHFQIGCGGENDFATRCFFRAQPSKKSFVIGQGGGINLDPGGELLFQPGASARPPK